MKRAENAIRIYKNLYMNPDENTIEEVHERVARCLAKDEEEFKIFSHLLNENILRPNSPCLINADYPDKFKNKSSHDQNLNACFVLELEDTMESIIGAWSQAAWIYAAGGGCGLPFTNLRERGSQIAAGGQASGPLEYAKVIQSVAETVKSGGKSRRAANLASFWYQHPQIKELITCKKTNNLSTFNVSVSADNELMNNVYENNNIPYPLISPNKNVEVGKLDTFELWNLIVDNAWESGDPGLQFYDTANRFNPLPSLGKIASSNPCSEVVLPANNCCVLASINLNHIIKYDEKLKTNIINWTAFQVYIYKAILFLNRIIDMTSFPTVKFRDSMLSTRPIGLGLMGLADFFVKMKIEYGSQESIDSFKQICKFLTCNAFAASIELAEKEIINPITIPDVDKDHFYNLLVGYGLSDAVLDSFRKNGKIANSTVSSIAPTGSVSISAECSYAFEPYMAMYWKKELVDNKGTLEMKCEPFFEICKNRGIDLTPELLDKISVNNGSVQDIEEIPEDIRKLFVCAHDIGWKKKIEMQSAGQEFITLGISSTCNLPHSATKEDVEEAYLLAWKSGLKGITVYRDGCLEDQPVQFGKKKESTKPTNFAVAIVEQPKTVKEVREQNNNLTRMKRPLKRMGPTFEIPIPHNDANLFITANYDSNGDVFEIFLRAGDQAGIINQLLDGISKLSSKLLQYGIPIEAPIKSLDEIGGTYFRFKLDEHHDRTESAESILQCVAKILDFHFNDSKITNAGEFLRLECNPVETNIKKKQEEKLSKCPVCKNFTLSHDTGCKGGTCLNCNYSSCG